jgi:hypothetical protein
MGLTSACSNNRGAVTNTYLRAHDGIASVLNADLRKFAPVPMPKKPVPPPRQAAFEVRREYMVALKDYPQKLSSQLRLQKVRWQELSRIVEIAQAKLGALNSAGADPQAVGVATLDLKSMGQLRRLLLEMDRFADLELDAMSTTQRNDDFHELVAGVLASFLGSGGNPGAAAVGGAKALGDIISKDKAAGDSLRAQSIVIGNAATQLNRDVIDYESARAQLNAAVQERYPGEDWSFLRQAANAGFQR